MSIQIPFESMNSTQKMLTYFSTRQQILDEKAIFSDETANYRCPAEPEIHSSVVVRLRAGKNNLDLAYVCYQGESHVMEKVETDTYFDYYEYTLDVGESLFTYCFKLVAGRLTVYYNKKGVIREPDRYFDFKIMPGFSTPNWAKHAVMYQIFVDRFYNGDLENDVVEGEYRYINKAVRQVKDWNKLPDQDGVGEFYGGDLQGVLDKLDYLQDLGVDVLYLNPIFVSPSNHKYDTQDYDYVDPHYGVIVNDCDDANIEADFQNDKAKRYIQRTTNKENLEASNQLLIKLIQEAHQRNMKVIMDGVFNHCGSFNKWMDREKVYANAVGYPAGAFSDKDSPYHSFFHFQNKEAWPDNPFYDGWWGHDTLPKLNYEGSEKLYTYVMDIAKKWMGPPYFADGWRLDVAADLGYTKEFNHQFWKDFRKTVKAINPEAIIIAEHYGDPSDWLVHGDQWDTVMNYDAFMEPVSWFLTGMQKHSDEFRQDLLGNHYSFFDAMRYNMARFHTQSLQVAMNQLSNHDHSRFLTRTNRCVGRTHTVGAEAADKNVDVAIMKEAVVIQMTWVGAPTIYYGDEAGVTGWTDPDNRRTYPWGNENKSLIELHRVLIQLRKELSALRTGSLKFLHGEYNLLVYGRFDMENQVVIVINNHNEPREVDIPVWEISVNDTKIYQQILETTREGHSTEIKEYEIKKGKIRVDLMENSAKILKCGLPF